MYLTRSEKLNIIPEEDFPTAILAIEQELDREGKQGFFEPEKGVRLYYEYVLAPNSRGSVVFVHGLSEFTKKYYEFAAYFVSQGYSVFLFDQRGHGRSHRDTDRPELIHINSFDQLVSDLDRFIEDVVRPASPAPLYLYAHSMGGAVGLLYLAKHKDKIEKAVVTSPLLVPRMNDLPIVPIQLLVSLARCVKGSLRKMSFSNEYRVGKAYVSNPGDSPNRVRYGLQWRDRERCYQSTPMTLGCVHQNLRLRRLLFRRKVTGAIQTPTLMLCAETDSMVRTQYQGRFAGRCAACTHEVLPGANHAFHTDRQSILTQALERILSYLEQ